MPPRGGYTEAYMARNDAMPNPCDFNPPVK